MTTTKISTDLVFETKAVKIVFKEEWVEYLIEMGVDFEQLMKTPSKVAKDIMINHIAYLLSKQ